MPITKSLKAELGLPVDTSDKDVCAAAVKATKAGTITKSRISALMAETDAPTNPDPNVVFNGMAGEKAAGMPGADPRVKHVSERFSMVKSASKWPNNREHARKGIYAPGNDAFYYETIPGMEHINDPRINTAQRKSIEDPSQFEYAKMGALFKSMMVRDYGENHPILQKMKIRMNEEDELLVKSALNDDEWVGPGVEKGDMIGMPRRLKEAGRSAWRTSVLSVWRESPTARNVHIGRRSGRAAILRLRSHPHSPVVWGTGAVRRNYSHGSRGFGSQLFDRDSDVCHDRFGYGYHRVRRHVFRDDLRCDVLPGKLRVPVGPRLRNGRRSEHRTDDRGTVGRWRRASR